MSQLTLGLVSGLGIWTIGMGATAVTGGFGGSGSKLETITFNSVNVKLPRTLEIIQIYEDLWCINKLFNAFNLGKSATVETTNSLTNNGIEGCLSVWWEKEIYDEENWRGSWNLVWAMKDNDYGTIFLYKIGTEKEKIERDSSFYSLKKEDNKWLLPGSTSVMNETNSIIPKAELIDKSNGWDFETNDNKICSSTNKCTSETPKRKSVNLNWVFVGGKKSETDKESYIYEWIQNIDQLMKNSDIKNKFSQIKGYFKLV